MAALHPKAGQPPSPLPRGIVEELDEVTIRFAGDAGEGIQLVGSQFAAASAHAGNIVCTLPDFPSEIRAPQGTLASACGFQVHLSKHPQHTPGDVVHTLVAMNPAALKANLRDLVPGGIVIVNSDTFTPEELEKAGYTTNPLRDGSLGDYQLILVPMTQLNREAVARVNLSSREVDRCKNFFALGLVCWLYERPLEPAQNWIREKYAKNPAMIEANSRTLTAGYQRGAASEDIPVQYRIGKAAAEMSVPAGRYRFLSGTEALALGLLTASRQANLPLIFSAFPLMPAGELLHRLCEHKQPNVKVIQAEDDLASLQIAIGASFGGAIGVTATSGPGLSLQTEALGLAAISELPCVIIDVQRAGPSTGMPSKSEQADLFQALYGRHGDCPVIVLAMATPTDGFARVLEAVRLAIRYMTPVILLTDAHLAHASESWRVPSLKELPTISVTHAPRPASATNSPPFLPYQRDDRLVRPWAIPGTPGLEHRTGGLEKEGLTGAVSFDPLNHEWMSQTRARKIANVAQEIPLLSVEGAAEAELLVLGWGSTYGAIHSAVQRCLSKGLPVASAHLRYLHPLPKNTGDVLGRYRKILVPELNAGQLCQVIRARYLVDAISFSKVQGRPFLVSEIERKIEEMLSQAPG
jgi:2-oxoglutarate ferredoxin oxidoreductase subunit alpha